MSKRFVFWLIVVLVCMYLAGLAGFSLATDHLASRPGPPKAEAIAVLTGGSGERIAHGAKLFQKKVGEKLLISGVNPQVSKKDLMALSGLSLEQFNCCVDVDRQARNTIGNAEQIARWARRNNYSSLLVVTSSYHMPRALLEMRKQAPDLKLHPVSVRSTGTARQHVVRRTITEYNKYLVVLVRPASGNRQQAEV